MVKQQQARGLGSPTTSTDCTGNTVNERLFYPFGERWTGAAIPNLGAHQTFAQLPDYDPEIDQYNTLNRHYSPMGRWLTPDPGGLNVVRLDDPQTWNMYAYARNNPTTLSDPSGLEPDPPKGITEAHVQEGCDAHNPESCKPDPAVTGQPRDTAQDTGWSLYWQVSASANFLGQELMGVADATVLPVVNAAEHPIGTVEGIANAAEHPVDTAKNIANGVVDTVKAAANGDPRAFGQVVGTVAAVAYTAENVKIRAYENTGGGGINFKNTPTTGSSIRFDIHPIEKGGPFRPHVDVTIKKPGVPSGPGSNLIKPISHWPWE